MNPKTLKQILQAVTEHDVTEFTLETPDYKLTVRRGKEVLLAQPPTVSFQPPSLAPPAPMASKELPSVQEAPPPPAPPTPASETPPPASEECQNCVEVKAPIVGTFYRSPSPDAPPYVKEGDRVEKGQVLCIIEAMKLMNEIESEVSGVVRKILVQNGEPVEYGQPLFLIDPV
ncbi:MAG: acetyl-CoA carboxylase biotin carboxyl carrier protein [Thermaceae bacterium]